MLHVLPSARGCSAGQMSMQTVLTLCSGGCGPWAQCPYNATHSCKVPGHGHEHGMLLEQPKLLAVACECVGVCALSARPEMFLRLHLHVLCFPLCITAQPFTKAGHCAVLQRSYWQLLGRWRLGGSRNRRSNGWSVCTSR